MQYNKRKRTLELRYRPDDNSISRHDSFVGKVIKGEPYGTVLVNLTDLDEPDRRTVLRLTEDEAVQLCRRILDIAPCTVDTIFRSA